MQSIRLDGTGLSVSRFAFGTASLHHLGAVAAQADHLRAAADAGFTHFDTAPLYGFGAAERALGQAFGGTGGPGLTIATKVGLYPPGGTGQTRLAMLGRKALGRIVPALSRPLADWGVARARASLDRSLAQLRRDHVDLLFLHEPDIDLVATDEWLRWLEDEAARRVGAFGIAGPADRLAPFIAQGNPLAAVVQAQDSLVRREADFLIAKGRALQMTYGYLSAAGQGAAEPVLAAALARNTTGAIVISTRNPARLAGFAALSRAAGLSGACGSC